MTSTQEQTGAPAPGQPTTERVKGIFSTIAPSYDRFNRLSSLGIDRLWRRRTVRYAALDAGSRVLDLAAGTGDLTLAMARQAAPREIVSTDFVPEMLAIGEAKAAAYHGRTKLAFQVADAQALPFPEDGFDVVTVAFGIRNMPDRAANFREVRRVLKPGGRYVILEFSTPTNALFRGLYHVYLGTVIPALGGMLTGDKPSFDYLNESIRAFPDQSRLATALYEAGFASVEWHDLTMGIAAVHVAVK